MAAAWYSAPQAARNTAGSTTNNGINDSAATRGGWRRSHWCRWRGSTRRKLRYPLLPPETEERGTVSDGVSLVFRTASGMEYGGSTTSNL